MINQLKTVLLLGLLTGVLLAVGGLVGGTQGLTIALGFSLLMNFGSYFWSHKIVLSMYKAKEVKKSDYPKLFAMVKKLSEKAEIPVPKIYVVPSNNPNAFATGRNPSHGIVAYTKGILSLLSEKELEGVTGHELNHIKNRDILVQTVAATIAGVISYVAMMARWSAIFGGFGNRNGGGGNIVELLVLAIITPIIAVLVQLAISRSREYLADESAARLLKDGSGLASALTKLESCSNKRPMRLGSEGTAHLFIVNPFKGNVFTKLLSTHPSVRERVRKLNNF